jgi:hypothetical protein
MVELQVGHGFRPIGAWECISHPGADAEKGSRVEVLGKEVNRCLGEDPGFSVKAIGWPMRHCGPPTNRWARACEPAIVGIPDAVAPYA